MPQRSFLQRLQTVGILSLSALFIGGIVLILVGINAVADIKKDGEIGYSRPAGQVRFSIGYDLSMQVWIAILGVAFGLLSFGFGETYIHFFDSWCSRQSQKGTGLDYARYLNSQPRAPVRYGLRGFPHFLTLRYLLMIMGIFASIAYKFVIVSPDVFMYENLDKETVQFKKPRLSMEGGNADETLDNDLNPWISDFPRGAGINRAFLHQYETYLKPPQNIIMTGRASCSNSKSGYIFYPDDSGYLLTREMVMVAKMTEEEGDFFITQNTSGWQRIETSTEELFDPPQRAILEYKVIEPGNLQVQWARRNHSSDTFREPVVQRVTYKMYYAVAQVDRYVRGTDCSRLTSVESPNFRILSASNDSIVETLSKTSSVSKENIEKSLDPEGILPYYSAWIEALVNSPDTSLVKSVSGIVRGVMSSYQSLRPRHWHIETGEEPFGSEDTTEMAKENPHAKYPFYVGWRAQKNTGCYVFAAAIFIILGLFAVLTAAFRLWLGPPTLTSWMGQHVYLAQTNAMNLSDKSASLATGHQVADPGIGKLRLSTKGEQAETDAILQLNVLAS
ncbi:hypothetical protein CDV36_013230 [Fusarium kuroshium]|uniref:Uncharacterized protein n=1 Tax=Fusarium kuroshium TaxID=2010991 RepID=A0A3M2RPE0_9HYPO|nr:hypothetical protein CDV36_013230 [Fusarium kuroshium]